MHPQLAFTWQLTEVHGWGLVGVHTALHLVEQGRPPLLLEKPLMSSLRPENREKLQLLQAPCEQALALAAQNPGRTLRLREFDVLHALGNGFQPGPPSQKFQGRRNVGVIAYEDTRFDAGVLERARRYDRIVVHSTYNQKLLTDQGFANIGFALQGIDTSELVVPPPSGRFGDRFVIFSGGKLEFRKGQDIVLAAFLRFHARHPDALLVTAWQNAWTEVGMTMAESPLAAHPPQVRDNRIDVRRWAFENGADEGNFLDLGFLGRHQIAGVLAECHAAVFPNRCEGATNLVAMEAMACGVPTILSANTGHMDLLVGDVCLTLDDQRPVPDRNGSRVGWGESSVDELVERLETLYADRSGARARADRAQRFIRGERTWSAFAKAFVAAAGEGASEGSAEGSLPANTTPNSPAAVQPQTGQPQAVTIKDAFALARQHQDAGRVAEAEDIHRRILAVRPELFAAHRGLAQALLAQKRTAEALRSARSATALQPDMAEAYAGLGGVLRQEERLGEAGRAFRRAVALQPDWLEGWKTLDVLAGFSVKGGAAIGERRHALCPEPLNILYRIGGEGDCGARIAGRRTCLRNLLRTLAPLPGRMTVVADRCDDDTVAMIERAAADHFGAPGAIRVHRTDLGSGRSWLYTRDLALELEDGEAFYVVEGDHLHLPGAATALLEGLERADYVSLHDRPDQYADQAPTPAGAAVAQPGNGARGLILTASSHWTFTAGAGLTFAARVGTLRQDKALFDGLADSGRPGGETVLADLAGRGRAVLAAVPGRSTPVEPGMLSPLVDWAAVARTDGEPAAP